MIVFPDSILKLVVYIFLTSTSNFNRSLLFIYTYEFYLIASPPLFSVDNLG